jgi:hypothetical protein
VLPLLLLLGIPLREAAAEELQQQQQQQRQ